MDAALWLSTATFESVGCSVSWINYWISTKKPQKQMLCCQLKLFKYLSFIVKVSRVAAFSCSAPCLIFVPLIAISFLFCFLKQKYAHHLQYEWVSWPPLREVRSLLLSLETLHVITAVVSRLSALRGALHWPRGPSSCQPCLVASIAALPVSFIVLQCCCIIFCR